MKRTTSKKIVMQMPEMRHVGCGDFWFFLPVPFLYKTWPLKAGEKILVTVQKAK